jgi:hypothetical protein
VRVATSLTPVALSCVLAIAACGSAGKPSASKAAASTQLSQSLKFSQCMRAHGEPNFPDPTASGGIQIQVGSGVDPFSPAFKAAQAACVKFAPGGPPATGHASARAKALTLAISECMRRHGVTDFPDPTLTPPPSPAGYGLIEDRDGVVLAIPNSIDLQSPAFRQAAAACSFDG